MTFFFIRVQYIAYDFVKEVDIIKLYGGRGKGAAPQRAPQQRAPQQRAPQQRAVHKPEREVSETSESRKRNGRKGVKIAVFVPLAIIIALSITVGALGFYVERLDTVFPNVWADGVNLSGLTPTEARRTLVEAGYESNAENVSATVIFNSSFSFTIYGSEAGLSFDAEDAVSAAFYFGRNGTFFQNKLTFLRSLFNNTELRNLSVSFLDEDFVREVVTYNTRRFNSSLVDGAFDITDESITIIKGAGIEAADEDEVFYLVIETLNSAMSEQAHLSVTFVTSSTGEADVDLHMLHSTIGIEPVSSYLCRETFTPTESRAGVTFDLRAAQVMLNNARVGEEVVIPLIRLEPETVEEDIQALLFRDVLGTRTTSFATSAPGRMTNIRVSSEFINGTVLYPGEEFCFDRVVGPRSVERGFRDGGAFIGGELINVTGGGICQTSSTLYNAVLYAGLEVVARRPHSFIVGYLPFGLDAAVSWGTLFFRFRNDTEYPIKIEAITEGTNVTMSIIGTETRDYTIRLRSVTLGTVAVRTIERFDEELAPGTSRVGQPGSIGVTAEVFIARIDSDGNVIDEVLLHRNSYQMMYRIVYLPPPEEDEYESEPPYTVDHGTEQPPTDVPELPPDIDPPLSPYPYEPPYPPEESQPGSEDNEDSTG